jgi:formylglycine-generating enzyme required for sulfatase activity
MNESIEKAIREKAKSIVVGSGEAAVELLRVEPGSFRFGAPEDELGRLDSDSPIRKVTITRPFYLGKYPITQGQYTAVTGKAPVKPAAPDTAIDQLTYADALAFCEALSKAAGVAVVLPTEAQWEYACRAGTITRFWSGDKEEDLAAVGWYRENSELRAREVGKKPANPWGFHDMHGNVCEFCRDVLRVSRPIPERDPVGPTDPMKGIMRGGGWMHPADYCRSATRLMSSDRFGGAGLRIAVEG